MPHLKRISAISLALLIVSAIDSIRNLPAVAMFGTNLVFFFVLGAVIFLIPTALVAAELSSTYTRRSGIYAWVCMAFGEKRGFLAIYLQWINTVIWCPTILSFIAGSLAYLINPALAQNKLYLVSVILIVFWSLTLVNLKGLQVSARFASICAVLGLLIPMACIILLAFYWLISGHGSEIHFSIHNMLPSLSGSHSWISLTAIMASFLGMELATVHVNQVKNPKKAFPRALFLGVLVILLTMILGSLSIAVVLPSHQIHLVDGVIEAMRRFLDVYHVGFLVPVLALMLVIGSLGEMVNWIISPVKGLLQAANNGFLPAFWRKENKNGVAGNLLITQAILVSFVCLAFLLVPTVSGSYWLLTDLSTELYMLMYVMMFIAAIFIKKKNPKKVAGFEIPGGKYGMWFVCALGLIGCALTLVVGFFPPSTLNVGGFWHYEMLFIIGLFVIISPVLLFYWYRFSHRSKP